MISIKRYLDSPWTSPAEDREPKGQNQLATAMEAYGSALEEIGDCSVIACPGMGDRLKRKLAGVRAGLSAGMTRERLAAAAARVRDELQNWGQGTAKHYEQKTAEVKDMLLVIARTAQSVGARDERSAAQMNEVTQRLKRIASLDDLAQVRSSVEKCASDLKTSIDRMTEEGRAVVSQLRKQVAEYRSKLEAAEELAWRDALTGLSSRLYVESQIQRRIEEGFPFSVALLDLNDFKKVNDRHGHPTGDELLRQFSGELRSARRATDVVGRWGGDEFILLLDCDLAEATIQVERLRERICGDYTIEFNSVPRKFRVDASFGLAGSRAGEEMKELVARADAAMYADKAASQRRRPALVS
jgi:diguanylate cyclase (GGDEF)-like protein